MADQPEILNLWPTPILVTTNDQHGAIKNELLALFYGHRDRSTRHQSPVYASSDDLYKRYKNNPALAVLIQFIMDGVFHIASQVNARRWKGAKGIHVDLTGIWFQISNGYGFHETHIHGNCSWSGVYYVQAGDSSRSPDDRKDGLLNGITRFYGPYMEFLAGGHGEFGNLYLEDNAWDSYPEDGNLVVFPSWLKHMVFPYNGRQDRVIVSFHAQVHSERGMQYGYDFN